MLKKSIIALIPARSGSMRVPDKNIKRLGNHPLIAYTISAAIESNLFDDVIVSTDNKSYCEIANYYGATTPFLRPGKISGSKSPDIEWVKYTLNKIEQDQKCTYQYFSILRPTSPFRTSETINRAWNQFVLDKTAHSLRAIEPITQHPGKAWVLSKKNRITPLFDKHINGIPWHSSQYAALPEIFVQNASLEIAKCSVIKEYGTISGNKIMPFFTKGLEGFDINNFEDWILANYYVNEDNTLLPDIKVSPF